MKLNGKVAWVLGASSGIGAAVARELVDKVKVFARRVERRTQRLHAPPKCPLPPQVAQVTLKRMPPTFCCT